MSPSVPKRADKLPVFKHKGRGLWCKTVLGKHRYFGRVADDPTGKLAVRRWLFQKDWLLAGLEPPPFDENGESHAGPVTVRDICNLYIESRELLLESGSIAQRTYDENFSVCKLIQECIAPRTPAKLVCPKHFENLLREINTRNKSPGVRGKLIGLVRSVFKHAYDRKQIDSPVDFGVFKKPPAKAMRMHRNKKGDQSFSPKEIRQLLDHATLNGRAMILLGLQAGMGNTELAELKRSEIRGEWLVSARAKTAIVRRVPLWPETIEAIKASIAAGPKDGELVFYKADGETYQDKQRTGWRVTNLYAYVAKKAGVTGHSFYDLRRTFSTVAQNMVPGDVDAVEAIMGHADEEDDMAALYRQKISDERLLAVVRHVRKWVGKLPKGGAK